MKCLNCGAELEEGVLFCGECGEKVSLPQKEKRFCRDCGKKLKVGSKYCSYCGAKIDGLSENDNEINTEIDNPDDTENSVKKSVDTSGKEEKCNLYQRRTKGKKEPSSDSGNSLESKKKDRYFELWNKLSGFAKTVSILFVISILLLIVSLVAHKVVASFLAVLQMTCLIVAVLIHLEKVKHNKGILFKYLTIIISILCVILNVMSYFHVWGKKRVKENPKNDIQNTQEADKSPSRSREILDVVLEKGSEYSYSNDHSNFYIATAVSDTVIKITNWHSASTSDNGIEFIHDVGTYRIDDAANGFSWIDSEHTGFYFNLQDKNAEEENLKSIQLVLFTVNKESTATVSDDIVETENKEPDISDTRDYMNGFDSLTNEVYQIASYTVEIPNYWKDNGIIDGGIQRYAEKGEKVAKLTVSSSKESDGYYEVSVNGLRYDNEKKTKMIESDTFFEVSDYEVIETGSVKGILYKGKINYNGISGIGEWFEFPSEDDRSWCKIILTQTDNTEYRYEEDFLKIIQSITKVEIIDEEENVSEADSVVTEESQDSDQSDASEESEYKEETADDKKLELLIMKGTDVNKAVKKAGEYGLSQQSPDEDFGHGTKFKSLRKDFGGLYLEIIYYTETDEILCANITTNKIASDSEQKEFINGMAGVLCPPEDIKEVSKWVKDNVGNKAKTTVGDFIYEVSLGPVDNALYEAGYRNWEDWFFAQ